MAKDKKTFPKIKKPLPFEFVLEELAPLKPYTRPMFGCYSVYVNNKIVLILRDRGPKDTDNGVWIATTQEHHPSLKKDFPSMRSLKIFGSGVTGWQVLPMKSKNFEAAVLKACEFIKNKDPRIGKIPKAKKPKALRVSKSKKTKQED